MFDHIKVHQSAHLFPHLAFLVGRNPICRKHILKLLCLYSSSEPPVNQPFFTDIHFSWLRRAYVHVHAYVIQCVTLYIYIYIYIYIYGHMYAYIGIYSLRMYKHVFYTHTYVRMYVCMYIYIYIYIHTHIHTYIHGCQCTNVLSLYTNRSFLSNCLNLNVQASSGSGMQAFRCMHASAYTKARVLLHVYKRCTVQNDWRQISADCMSTNWDGDSTHRYADAYIDSLMRTCAGLT
jgi:hypothetical protein